MQETELSTLRRVGASEYARLGTQNNLAGTYQELGREEQALSMRREVYSGFLNLNGQEHRNTLDAANNLAVTLNDLQHSKEAKALSRETMPVARRVLGESHDLTLRMMWNYADALYRDDDATLDDLREAVTTLEDAGRIARRVLGSSHPLTGGLGGELLRARVVLRARETPSPGSA